ncbi:FAD-linked oxidoreductase-like protein [Phlebopus sp. FC_14]|nr:FAD-linked oxidoreductase-like protein [Phlebopus sp. FC_14]
MTCPSLPYTVAPRADSSAQNVTDLPALLRAYTVYALTSIPALVDHAPQLLDVVLKIPLLGSVAQGIVRKTFYEQFVGCETTDDAPPLLLKLRQQNKGVLFGYSVEVDEKEAGGDKHGVVSVDHAHQQQPVYKQFVDEIINSIQVAGDFEDSLAGAGIGTGMGRKTMVAAKLSALLPRAQSLNNFSIHLTRTRPALSRPVPFPGAPSSSDFAVLRNPVPPAGSPLTAEDVKELKELYDDLDRICTCAKERGVKVIIDAEHSWYQPAIDAFGLALMEKFNKLPDERGSVTRWLVGSQVEVGNEVQPLVYATYQAYLRRAPTQLAHSLALAREKSFALGVKLVRGAYHPRELAAYASSSSQQGHTLSISPDPYPPVHLTKEDTDACYNACAALVVRAIADDIHSSSAQGRSRPPRIGALFGTHNWRSCELVLEELIKNGLAHPEGSPGVEEEEVKQPIVVPPEVVERVTFGQLYGMSDSLTNYLVARTKSSTLCVVKYVPYGSLMEVMPYLSRRAIENKSVLGNGRAARERKEAAVLIWKKVFGGFGI